MPESEFMCLAVSRCMQGHYAAGIDLATGQWVRLVGHRRGSPLGLFEPRVYVQGKPRQMKPLDVVNLNLDAHVPKQYQPHNWTLASRAADRPIIFLRNAAEDETLNKMIRGLAEVSGTEELLFGSETSEMTLDVDNLTCSLHVVHSPYLYWRKTSEFNKGRNHRILGSGPSIQGEFKFGMDSQPYGLPLGDANWENRIRPHLPETGSLKNDRLLERMDPPLDADILLTVSFDDDVILDGRHYKFIAGVLPLPKLRTASGISGNSNVHKER
jgi:hypothetical protein